jgi:hypothetical protein
MHFTVADLLVSARARRQVMKESAGRANPAALNEILMRKLNQA